MAKRIAIWTLAGIIIAAGWGLYAFAVHGAPLGEWLIVQITMPVALFRRLPMTVYQVVAINAATYALLGLLLEPIWRARRVRQRTR